MSLVRVERGVERKREEGGERTNRELFLDVDLSDLTENEKKKIKL